MLRPGGYGVTVEPGKKPVETDTFTCVHCNAVVEVLPRQSAADMGGWCGLCSKPVCKGCAGKECVPFEKKLKAWEDRDKFLRSVLG